MQQQIWSVEDSQTAGPILHEADVSVSCIDYPLIRFHATYAVRTQVSGAQCLSAMMKTKVGVRSPT